MTLCEVMLNKLHTSVTGEAHLNHARVWVKYFDMFFVIRIIAYVNLFRTVDNNEARYTMRQL